MHSFRLNMGNIGLQSKTEEGGRVRRQGFTQPSQKLSILVVGWRDAETQSQACQAYPPSPKIQGEQRPGVLLCASPLPQPKRRCTGIRQVAACLSYRLHWGLYCLCCWPGVCVTNRDTQSYGNIYFQNSNNLCPYLSYKFSLWKTLGRLSKSQWGCMDEINPCSLLQRAGGGGGSFLELGPFLGFLFRLLLSMPSHTYKVRSEFSMGCLIIWRGTLSTNIKPRLNAWLETLAGPLWFCWVGKVSGLASWMRDRGRSSCRAETLSSERKPLSHSSRCPH